MSQAIEAPKKSWTEAELQALPEDGFTHEVVNGELVMSPKNRLGMVLDSSTGFWMFNRNCRAPDISFVTRARMAALRFGPKEKRFFPGAPDLAVEILSPNNTRAEIDARLKDFFSSGTRLAWIIDPESESVEVCRSLTD